MPYQEGRGSWWLGRASGAVRFKEGNVVSERIIFGTKPS